MRGTYQAVTIGADETINQAAEEEDPLQKRKVRVDQLERKVMELANRNVIQKVQNEEEAGKKQAQDLHTGAKELFPSQPKPNHSESSPQQISRKTF